VFVVVAVQAQQFPVAAIGRVVVVIVIPVMDGQFTHVGARELAGAAPADPRVDLQRLFPVAPFALLGRAPGFGDDAVQFARVTCAHAATWKFKQLSEARGYMLHLGLLSHLAGIRPLSGSMPAADARGCFQGCPH